MVNPAASCPADTTNPFRTILPTLPSNDGDPRIPFCLSISTLMQKNTRTGITVNEPAHGTTVLQDTGRLKDTSAEPGSVVIAMTEPGRKVGEVGFAKSRPVPLTDAGHTRCTRLEKN